MLRRKNVKHYGLIHPSGVGKTYEPCTSAEKLEDGNVVNRFSIQEVGLDEVDARLQVVSPEDYTLENLLKAGVPLDQVNLNGFMDVSDAATKAEQAEQMSLNAFNTLREEEDKVASKKVKAQTEQNVNENAE